MLIGISGKMGTGKTTLGDEIELLLAHESIYRTAFACPLKEEASRLYGFDLSLCYSQQGKNTMVFHPDLPGGSMSVREVLQWHGQDRRGEDPDYWVKAMRLDLLSANDRDIIIIDDVRYPNEAEMVDDMFGLLVRLEPYDEWQPGPYASHESEIALDGYAGFDLTFAPEFGQLPSVAEIVVGQAHIESFLGELGRI